MQSKKLLGHVVIFAIATTWIVAAGSSDSLAQVQSTNSSQQQDPNSNEDPNAEDPNSNNGNNNNRSNPVIGNTAGVSIDALGVVRRGMLSDHNLNEARNSEAFARRDRRNPKVRATTIRKVSLNRLESAAANAIADGGTLSDEMRYLAGLTRIQYVFLYPDSGDVVIAGPAGDWVNVDRNTVVDSNTRQPVLRLEDLIVALRAFPVGGRPDVAIRCSIDPTQQGLARMQAFIQSISHRPPSAATITNGLKKSLGQQVVTIQGVPATSRFAKVMVEADYRMKLIGIGLESPPVKIASYVSLARPKSRGNNMARWYFTPKYEGLSIGEDQLAMRLMGQGVQLISEAEHIAANGRRHASDKVDSASERFVEGFTRKYSALAERTPVYAELRNLIDISIAAAFLQVGDAYGLCGWQPEAFLDENQVAVETRPAPKSVATAANAIWKGSRLMTPVGGGINIEPRRAFDNIVRDDGLLDSLRGVVPVEALGDDDWWWD